jgi:transmembrane sensor
MEYSNDHIEYLWRQYIAGKASEAELEALFRLNNSTENEELQDTVIEKILAEYPEGHMTDTDLRERMLQKIIGKQQQEAPVVKRQFLRRSGWAAAVILLLGAGFYLWQSAQQQKPSLADNKALQTKILPGTNKAVLSVGDTLIDLNNEKSGIITSGNQITYDDGERIAGASQMLSLSTPRGGQYQAVLPDGTKVWLNAASSIRFPSRFSNDRREVTVSGEVYMEIAPNLHAPFSVHTGKSTIQVLGTAFNINAYPDEASQQTTLVNGSVKITLEPQTSDKENAVILRPGDAASINENIQVIRGVNTDQVLAWKNGIFNFEGLPLSSVAKQLERWYDIEIRYDEKIASLVFRGKIYRNTNLVNFLDILDGMGFAYQLDERVLHLEKK